MVGGWFGFFLPCGGLLSSPSLCGADFTGGVGDHLTCNLKHSCCLLPNAMHSCTQERATKRWLIKWNSCLQEKETGKTLNQTPQTHGALLLEPCARRHPTAACSAQPCSPLPQCTPCSMNGPKCSLGLNSGLCQGSWSMVLVKMLRADFALSLLITEHGWITFQSSSRIEAHNNP